MATPVVPAERAGVKLSPICPRCGRHKDKHLLGKGWTCSPCDRKRKARYDRTRTKEQRQAENRRAAERKGKTYAAGVLWWKRGGAAGHQSPGQVADGTWRRLEEANARQAWEWWRKERAPAWWLAAVRAAKEANGLQRDREAWRRAKHRKRLAARNAIHRSLNVHGFERLYETVDRCGYCRCRLTRKEARRARSTDATVDHVLPLSRGGAHSHDNLVVCCYSCNSRKRDATPAEWLARDPCREAARSLALYRRRFGDERQGVLP